MWKKHCLILNCLYLENSIFIQFLFQILQSSSENVLENGLKFITALKKFEIHGNTDLQLSVAMTILVSAIN